MSKVTNYFDEIRKHAEELKRLYKPKGLIIAVAGLAASGKTTGAKSLAEALGLRYYSTGAIFREKAQEMGISIEDFSKIRSDELDFEADKETVKRMMEGNVVVDGRLVGVLASVLKELEESEEIAIIRILYNPPIEIRAERYAQREGKPYDVSFEMIKERDKADMEKYSRMYGIKDLTDEKYYDIILDNSKWSAEDAKIEPLKHIISYLKRRNRLHLLNVEPLLEYLKKIGCFDFE